MASTTFIDNQTVIYAAWLNDVNNAVYNGIFQSTSITAPTMICTGTASGVGFTNLVNNTFASPAGIGTTTPNTGAFTTLISTGNQYFGNAGAIRGFNVNNPELSFQNSAGTGVIFNFSNTSGNNGNTYGVLFRGLISGATSGASLATFGVDATASSFTGSIANASGILGFPSYSSPTTITYGATNQAPSNGIVTVAAWGPYRNGLTVQVGNTSALGTTICYLGDDINANTKAGSFSFPIKAGSWYSVTNWPGYDGFENVFIYFWPVS